MKHCAGCASGDKEFACSKFGGEGACPEDKNGPRSIEGRAFAEAANDVANQLRIGVAGVTGIDASACLALMTGRGLDPDFSSLFLPYLEAGILSAIAERREHKAK